MVNLLDRILGSTGQERTAALRDLGRRAEYYVPPELRGILGFAAEMTPSETLNRAAVAGGEMLAPGRTPMQRVGSAGRMLSETAGVAAPIAAGPRAGMTAAQSLQEGLLGFSMAADDAGRRFVERMTQPGPVPTMNAIFPSGSSLDEVFGFVDKNKPIYHSGPADMAEEMQKWGVEPSYGPWVREIAAGAVDDVDDFLDQTPPAAWWSDQPDWIKMKVARAAKKPVSDVTVDDIRKHGHLAIASADDYSDVAFRIGDEGLDSGEYSFVEDLAGNRMRFYETPLYSEGNYPFGIERNEIVTGEAIEPAYSLTGDDLVKFMQRQGILSADTPNLPAPRNKAEAMAKQVLEMRAAGRAGDVTEEMMAATDPQYMFANTPLPMDEASRMARARELGFDANVEKYHGTAPSIYSDEQFSPDFASFNPSRKGQLGAGIYVSPDVRLPNKFARAGDVNRSDFDPNTAIPRGGSIIPVYTRNPNPASLSEMRNVQYGLDNVSGYIDLSRRGTEGLIDKGFTGVVDGMEENVFDPRNIRSRFARFDPAFAHLRNLSAGVGGLGLLSGLYSQEDTQ